MSKVTISIEGGDSITAEATDGMAAVILERIRQITVEGYDSANDDNTPLGELAKAAACYCGSARLQLMGAKASELDLPAIWPWEEACWKPKDPRRDLVRAAALIIAQIDVIDRAEARESR
jgi:hypothetical protein